MDAEKHMQAQRHTNDLVNFTDLLENLCCANGNLDFALSYDQLFSMFSTIKNKAKAIQDSLN
jgi:hypothetical protein